MNKKYLLGIIITGLSIGAGAYYYKNKQKNEQVEYIEEVAQRRDITIKVLATGTVLPENRLEIKAPIAGRIEKVLVDEGDKIKKGQVLAWMSSTERAAMLDAARAEGADQLKKWEEMYQAAPIISPINGTIISRNAESGQTITTTDAILVMSDLLIVKAQVDETDMAKVSKNQKAEIILDAYPEVTIPSRVDKIAFEAETVNNVTNYKVDVIPHKPTELMRSGMTANITFYVHSINNVLTISNSALIRDENDTYVMTRLNKKAPAEKRKVVLGLSNERYIEVKEGLQENEVVLIANKKVTKSNGKNSNPFGPKVVPMGGRGSR